jgi:K+-transporting ATPase ATPase A chain
VSVNGVAQIVVFLALLTLLTPALGAYIARVMEGRPVLGVSRLLGPVERGIYRALRVDPARQQGWRGYAAAVLVFNAVGFAALYAILRLQGVGPLNPLDLPGMRWDVAFNTASSFVTNTSWQFYGGESTLSYLSQALGIAVQSFVSAAVGLAVAMAVFRGFARRGTGALGNFWVDLTRATLYVMLPLTLIWALALASQGVVQSLDDPVEYRTLEARTLGATDEEGGAQTQTVPRGAVASQVAVRSLGTVGGGYFNTNAATPFENPTPLANLVQMLALLLIPAALTATFGRVVGSRRQGWALYWAMIVIVVVALAVALPFEQRGSEVLQQTGVELSAGDGQAGGNMSDKEVRFGIASTVLLGVATTASSDGAVNGGFDAVVSSDAGTASMLNPGPQGFGEAFYAYSSQWNNNGSAMAGYGATELSTTLGGVAMLLGRFAPLLAVLALAGALSRKQVAPFSAGTLRTTTPTFVVTLVFVIILVAALNFIPALALGPLATELSGRPF